MGNNSSSDPVVARDCLLEKLEKENSFLKGDLRNKDVIIQTCIENITDLNEKIISQSFSYNQYVTENPNKDVDIKSPEDTNIQRINKIPQKKKVLQMFFKHWDILETFETFSQINNTFVCSIYAIYEIFLLAGIVSSKGILV